MEQMPSVRPDPMYEWTYAMWKQRNPNLTIHDFLQQDWRDLYVQYMWEEKKQKVSRPPEAKDQQQPAYNIDQTKWGQQPPPSQWNIDGQGQGQNHMDFRKRAEEEYAAWLAQQRGPNVEQQMTARLDGPWKQDIPWQPYPGRKAGLR